MKTLHDSETPQNGQQVLTACAFIHHNFDGVEKVFLPKRSASKKFLPDVYELPGGHINFGESHVGGLKREVKEEFGKSIVVGDPFFVFDYKNKVKGTHSSEVIYFATFVDGIEDITLNPDDHSEYGWYAENEIPKAFTPQKGAEDIEFIAIQKGFAFLDGQPPKF